MTTYHLQDTDNRDDDGVTYELEGDASRITAYLDGPLRRDVRPEGIDDIDEAIRALNAGDFDVAHTAAMHLGVYLTEVHPDLLDTIASDITSDITSAILTDLANEMDEASGRRFEDAAYTDAAVTIARAALAAMPQPIGYAALIDGQIESIDWESADEPGAYDYARVRAATYDGIVVALVPVQPKEIEGHENI